ncbi:hypothetical protein LPJ66_004711 [Kickxella alabastrina]|uniref:Uncharacterized protein n=1 Tax=Kickxella alabastrina TaxID=61397 RepID=A0ACC1IGS0_9FUNG|nr:hypothetical protein LPJ66_004711 [Kickxella alabastrina]
MKLLCKLTTLALLLSGTALASHIRKDLVEIENDAIVLVSATTVLESSSGRIAHLPVSPSGSIEGTKGLVYILPELENCQPVERSREYLATSYIRIALISDEGECPIVEKLKQAQFDGAVGAFVYSSTMDAVSMSTLLSGTIKKSKLSIPVMIVDRDYGEMLLLEVTTLMEEAQINNNSRYRAIFASIFSEENSDRLSGWEISLITLVVVLALCFFTSMSFHVSSSRRRAGRYLRDRAAGDLTKQIQTLPSCALDRLHLRTVNESDVKVLSECTTPLDSILNPSIRQRSLRSLESNPSSIGSISCCLDKLGNNSCCVVGLNAHVAGSEKSAATDITCKCPRSEHRSCCGNDCADESLVDPTLKGCIATCIVCIDDFIVGSKMRILPCGHNYHIECIDPWLTSKSSLCPLCKYDTRSVLTDLERSHSGPRIQADLDGFEDILGGSNYSESDDNSSYLAESRSRLPIANMARMFCDVAHYGVTTPVRALVRRLSRNPATRATPDIEMPMDSQRLGRQSRREYNPFEDSNAVFTASIPVACVIDIEGDDTADRTRKSGYSGYSGGRSNFMIEVKTNDPILFPEPLAAKNSTQGDNANNEKDSEQSWINIDDISLSTSKTKK